MAQEQSLPEDYNTDFDPAEFLKKLKEQAATEKEAAAEDSFGD
ncbi:MAG: cell division protein [Corynebacterium casei]|uniref:Cell division protein n=1 Tax=Corynebacterium casei UCMA 3821 TaxID=1110505 RepID=G7I0Q3_9CORY|nr:MULTISPECIES: hypothetical protein [Corynebacterium]MDN5706405.1 cell division protein [Corynebacterium casei]MDN5799067.1 cell division protein [Corynebacterium casei]MDN5902300.1 cell division protein [Corynebacterium casei]MDN5921365.1 cell division protein [Corynebacterium casei]MDN6136494.1 cell division protein [Corynebacterium sp.]